MRLLEFQVRSHFRCHFDRPGSTIGCHHMRPRLVVRQWGWMMRKRFAAAATVTLGAGGAADSSTESFDGNLCTEGVQSWQLPREDPVRGLLRSCFASGFCETGRRDAPGATISNSLGCDRSFKEGSRAFHPRRVGVARLCV